MKKGYRIRIYPNMEQIQLINRHFGACRFVWNYMINVQEENHEKGGKYLSGYDLSKMLTQVKHEAEYAWLNEISYGSLQITCIRLHSAYLNFFKGVFGHPRFKSKKNAKQSYPVCSNRFYFTESYCRIQRIGNVKYKTDAILPLGRGQKFYNVVLSRDGNKYYISFCVDCDKQATNLTSQPMGIDLGIKTTATISYGDKWYVIENINKSTQIKRIQNRIKYYQRRISHKYDYCYKQTGKYKKSNNIRKLEGKVSRLYKKLTDIRTQNIHQWTHYLVAHLKPNRVVMETLSIEGMMKNKRMRNLLQEQLLAEFIRQMRYKCEWNSIEFIQANRYYPSSKRCSKCGFIKKNLDISERTYVCEKCGFVIDRDYNAALNLSQYKA